MSPLIEGEWDPCAQSDLPALVSQTGPTIPSPTILCYYRARARQPSRHRHITWEFPWPGHSPDGATIQASVFLKSPRAIL